MQQETKGLSRRTFLRASVAVAGLALVACAPAAAPAGGAAAGESSATQEGAKIAYWTFWADRWGEFQQQLVDQYNEEQQEVQVEMLIVPWGDLPVKLLTAVSAGNPPDFSIIGRSEVVEWAVREGVLPLDDYIAASTETKKEDWFDVAWNECVWQAKTYAQPFESGTYAAWYNMELFEGAGLDATKAPVTWADVDIAAEKITQGSAADGYTTVGFIPWGSGRRDLLGWLAGGEWYDETAQQITAVTPENIAAMEWVKQYADKYGGEALERFRQGLGGEDTTDDPFYRGQVGTTWRGSWALSAKQEYAPDLKFTVAPLPYRADTGNDSINQGSACVLPKGSPQPDAAYKFLAWMSITGISKWVPNAADMVSRKDQTEIYPSALPDNEEFRGYWKLYNDALAYAHHEPSMPARRFWNDQLAAAVDAIVLGKKSPEQALQDAQDTSQRELDKALGKA